MISRNSLVEWPDGCNKLCGNSLAVLQSQQQFGEEHTRVCARLRLPGRNPLVQPSALGGRADISHSRIAAREAISTSTVKDRITVTLYHLHYFLPVDCCGTASVVGLLFKK